MNVYDFDGTIYRGDSTVDLVLYCYRHDFRTWISIPRTALMGLLYLVHAVPKYTFKRNLYHMFIYIHDHEKIISDFVSTHSHNIQDWYLSQKKDDDLIISASPEFLIRKMCASVGIENVIASQVDFETGACSGLNCHGQEKVKRFRQAYPGGRIEEFYSDSKSDLPLATIAGKAYLVRGARREVWKR